MDEQEKQGSPTLADRLLEEVWHSGRQVSVYLVSGFQLKGEVIEFDADTVLFKHKEGGQLIMRSAIATMYPLSDAKHDASEWWRGYVSSSDEPS